METRTNSHVLALLSLVLTGCFLFPQKPPASPCATNNGGCNVNATCSLNALNEVVCACNGGFTGDGKTFCNPEQMSSDPCSNGGGCDPNATCSNDNGTAVCTCRSGYAGDGTVCVATSGPCAENNGGCDLHAACSDGDGGISCVCDPGYTGDGFFCEQNPPDAGPGGPDAGPGGHDAGSGGHDAGPGEPDAGPGGSDAGAGVIGDPCSSVGSQSSCGSGLLCEQFPSSGDYCTELSCASDSDCGSSHGHTDVCVGASGSSTTFCLQGCAASTACASGLACWKNFDSAGVVTGFCAPSCLNSACSYGETCNATTHGCDVRTCTSSSGCSSGQVCAAVTGLPSNVCVPNCSTNTGICPSGTTCNTSTGVCSSSSSSCNTDPSICTNLGEVCDTATGSCVTSCVSDPGLCTSGQTCNTSTGMCQTTSSGFGIYGGPCTTTSQCQTGLICELDTGTSGYCYQDCTTGETCSNTPTGASTSCALTDGTNDFCVETCVQGSTVCPTGTTCKLIVDTSVTPNVDYYYCLN